MGHSTPLHSSEGRDGGVEDFRLAITSRLLRAEAPLSKGLPLQVMGVMPVSDFWMML